MQVKSIAECSMHSAVLLTCIKLPHGFKTFILSIFESLLKTCFTVYRKFMVHNIRRKVKTCVSHFNLCILMDSSSGLRESSGSVVECFT